MSEYIILFCDKTVKTNDDGIAMDLKLKKEKYKIDIVYVRNMLEIIIHFKLTIFGGI